MAKSDKYAYVEIIEPVGSKKMVESFLDKFLKEGSTVACRSGGYSLSEYCKERNITYFEASQPPQILDLVSFMIQVSGKMGVTKAAMTLSENGVPVIVGVFP